MTQVKSYEMELAKLEGLRTELRGVESQIADAAKRRGDPQQAAKALLDGASVADAAAQMRNAKLDGLHDQKRVLERAIALQGQELRKLEQEQGRHVCEEHADEIRQQKTEVIRAAVALAGAINELELVYTELSEAGVRPDLRPAHWTRHGFEQVVANGLADYLEHAETHWHLNTKKIVGGKHG